MNVSSARVQSGYNGSQPAPSGTALFSNNYDLSLPDINVPPPPITMRLNHNQDSQYTGNLNF